MNARARYKRAVRSIRATRAPANSAAAWRLICRAFDVAPSPCPWGSDALRVQSLLQSNSYPPATLHHSLAHRVLNFPSLIRNYDRQRRASNLSARMRHAGKLKTLAGGYVALPGDDSEARRDEWRAIGASA